jgi:hypothetical protein
MFLRFREAMSSKGPTTTKSPHAIRRRTFACLPSRPSSTFHYRVVQLEETPAIDGFLAAIDTSETAKKPTRRLMSDDSIYIPSIYIWWIRMV